MSIDLLVRRDDLTQTRVEDSGSSRARSFYLTYAQLLSHAREADHGCPGAHGARPASTASR